MTLQELFHRRNPDHSIRFFEQVVVRYGYERRNRRIETGQRRQCYMEVDGHKVAVLYSLWELQRVRAESGSGRGIYEGLLVHANRRLTEFGIQLR